MVVKKKKKVTLVLFAVKNRIGNSKKYREVFVFVIYKSATIQIKVHRNEEETKTSAIMTENTAQETKECTALNICHLP